jgi:anti-anti-sigma factor
VSATFLPVTALMQLQLSTSYPSADTARVVVAGEVDMATSAMLGDWLFGLLCGQPIAVLEVDLAECGFLDCTGIGVLVGARNAAVHTGRQMLVIRAQPIVRRVLELTGLLDIFTAPVDQPQGPPARSEPTAGIGPAPVTFTVSPHMLVAA